MEIKKIVILNSYKFNNFLMNFFGDVRDVLNRQIIANGSM
jgi:hypothetical protein